MDWDIFELCAAVRGELLAMLTALSTGTQHLGWLDVRYAVGEIEVIRPYMDKEK
jgi:hypothetical protein